MEEIDGFECSNNCGEDEERKRDIIKMVVFGVALAVISVISCICIPH